MKLFNIEYSYNGIAGTAFVCADTPSKAIQYLKTNGKFNGTPKVYNVMKIVETDKEATALGIVSEVYKDPGNIAKTNNTNSDNKTIVVEKERVVPIEQPIDINSLSEEQIKELKLRLDKHSKTLFVDRIGSINRPNAHDGYTVFVTSTIVATEVLDRGIEVDLIDSFTHRVPIGVYVKEGNRYKFLGTPYTFDYVESEIKKVPIHEIRKKGFPRKRLDRVSWYKDHTYDLGLFILHPKSKKRWRLLKKVDKAPGYYRKILQDEIDCIKNTDPKTINYSGAFNHGDNSYKWAVLAIGKIRKNNRHANRTHNDYITENGGLVTNVYYHTMYDEPLITRKFTVLY